MDKIEKLAHQHSPITELEQIESFLRLIKKGYLSLANDGWCVTPKSDIADEDGLKALENRKPKRRVWTPLDAS